MLFVGGTAGQVVVLHFEQEEKEVDIKVKLQLYHLLLLFTSLPAFCFILFFYRNNSSACHLIVCRYMYHCVCGTGTVREMA